MINRFYFLEWAISSIISVIFNIAINSFKSSILSLFSIILTFQYSWQYHIGNIKFADDWIGTEDLWYRKQPLYQLSHYHFPTLL